MAGRATLTAKAILGVLNAQVIMQGHAGPANGTSFQARIIRNFTAQLQGKSVGTFAAKQIQNAVVQVAGHASLRPNAPLMPLPNNATVRIFGFAANPFPLVQFFPRATGRFQATLTGISAQLTVNGRATFSPKGSLLNNSKDSFAGRATGRFNSSFAGQAIPVFGQVFLGGHASGVFHGIQINNAKVGIFAGNPVFTPVQASVSIRGRATLADAAQQINNARASFAGHSVSQFFSTIAGSTFNNGVVRIAGTASVRAVTPTIPANVTLRLSGHAAITATAKVIQLNLGVVSIQGRATARLLATAQGNTFNNGVVTIAGRSVLFVSPFQFENAIVSFAGTATGSSFQSRLLQRAVVGIAGTATLTPQVPRQTLVWISGNTLQYKVWQYNMESTVRVLGTTWTVQSVGLSFQSIALELVMTEAGWGN